MSPVKPPKRSKATAPAGPRGTDDPLRSPAFVSLRGLYWSLAHGDLPLDAGRSPAEDARIVTFFALQELLRGLDTFAFARMRGEQCHLVVSEAGEQEGREVTIDLRIEPETSPSGAALVPEAPCAAPPVSSTRGGRGGVRG